MAKRKKQSKMYTRLVDAKTRKVPATPEVVGDNPKESVEHMVNYLYGTCNCCNDPFVADSLASGKAILAELVKRLRVSGISDDELLALTGATS